jgi:hypothetical protein
VIKRYSISPLPFVPLADVQETEYKPVASSCSIVGVPGDVREAVSYSTVIAI